MARRAGCQHSLNWRDCRKSPRSRSQSQSPTNTPITTEVCYPTRYPDAFAKPNTMEGHMRQWQMLGSGGPHRARSARRRIGSRRSAQGCGSRSSSSPRLAGPTRSARLPGLRTGATPYLAEGPAASKRARSPGSPGHPGSPSAQGRGSSGRSLILLQRSARRTDGEDARLSRSGGGRFHADLGRFRAGTVSEDFHRFNSPPAQEACSRVHSRRRVPEPPRGHEGGSS